jgi:hypothetical protein
VRAKTSSGEVHLHSAAGSSQDELVVQPCGGHSVALAQVHFPPVHVHSPPVFTAPVLSTYGPHGMQSAAVHAAPDVTAVVVASAPAQVTAVAGLV